MKVITSLFILSCLGLCFVSSLEITTWGITDPDATLLGNATVYAKQDNYQYQVRALTFPMVNA